MIDFGGRPIADRETAKTTTADISAPFITFQFAAQPVQRIDRLTGAVSQQAATGGAWEAIEAALCHPAARHFWCVHLKNG